MKRITKYLLAAFVFFLGIHGFSTNVCAAGERVFLAPNSMNGVWGRRLP